MSKVSHIVLASAEGLANVCDLYIRESDKEHQLKLSDVNLALGEVGLESDQYEQAITDLQASLRLREFALEPTDRRIAEV